MLDMSQSTLWLWHPVPGVRGARNANIVYREMVSGQ